MVGDKGIVFFDFVDVQHHGGLKAFEWGERFSESIGKGDVVGVLKITKILLNRVKIVFVRLIHLTRFKKPTFVILDMYHPQMRGLTLALVSMNRHVTRKRASTKKTSTTTYNKMNRVFFM